MLGTLSLLLGIGLLSLLLTMYSLSRSPERSVRKRTSGRWHRSAEGRAQALLQEMLSELQYQQLIQSGYLEVVSPSIAHRTYRIPAAGGLVKIYEHGRAIMELCLQPVEPLPEGDVVLCRVVVAWKVFSGGSGSSGGDAGAEARLACFFGKKFPILCSLCHQWRRQVILLSGQ